MKRAAWNPRDYRDNSAVQEAWAHELIGRLSLGPKEHVLDIGCGDGRITARLAGMAPDGRVVGIDSSRDMIEHARREFPPDRHPNLVFLLMDARAMTFQEEFTVAFSNAALHWVAEHPLVLAGLRRALVPGGRCLLQMGGRGNAQGMVEVVREVMAAPRWSRCFMDFDWPYCFPAPDEYSHWVIEAGLEPVRAALLPKSMVHPSAAGLAGWFRTTWFPFVERVAPGEREAFLEDVMAAFIHLHPPDADGSVRLGMVRLEVEAVRPIQ